MAQAMGPMSGMGGQVLTDTQAFEAARRGLLRIARRFVPTLAAAEEAVQEAFCKAAASWESYRGEGDVMAWLRRIVVRCCFDLYKRPANREVPRAIFWRTESASEFDAEQEAMSRIGVESIVQLIEELPYEEREILHLRIRGMQYQQMAAVLDVPVGTVKSRLHRARRLLKKMLDR